MMNKRGALELSINAVVVIIIAIVMLGLALGFMKGLFGGVIEQFEGVSKEVQKQMEETLKQSTKTVALSTTSLDMKPGQSNKKIYLGINNFLTQSTPPVDFYIFCSNCGTGRKRPTTAACGSPAPPEKTCSSFNSGSSCDDIIVTSLQKKPIDRGKIDVIPVKVSVKSNAKADTYLIPITICGKETTGATPSKIVETVDLYVNVG